jgi:Mor family transcriptional regulator
MSKIDDSFISFVKNSVTSEIKDIKPESLDRIIDGISSAYGGELVYICKNYNKLIGARNSKIIDHHKAGSSIATLSIKFLLSERQIKRIVKKT